MNSLWRFLLIVWRLVAFTPLPGLAKPRPPAPPFPEDSLQAWRFNGEHWLTNPRLAPITFLNLRPIESWSGHALRFSGPERTLLALPASTADGQVILPGAGPGTLRFYFAPDWSSAGLGCGPGQEAHLLEFGAWSERAAESWGSLKVDPAGTALRFTVRQQGREVEWLRAPLEWCEGEWHQVALTWTPQGATILYLDGQPAAAGPDLSLVPSAWLEGTPGFCLGSDVRGGNLAGGQFEELHTFARACTGEELAMDFKRNAPLAALGPVTPQEEQARWLAASQPTPLSGSGGGQSLPSSPDYGCELWLRITPAPPDAVTVTLHNTVPGRTYQLWSRPQVESGSWTVELTFPGAAGQDYTQRTVPMAQRPMLFFRAIEVTGYVVEQSFDGLRWSDTVGEVPDTMGAVGPNHFVELLNGESTDDTFAIAVFDKNTGALSQKMNTSSFFSVPSGGTHYPTGDRMVDPRILFDHQGHRWIACAIDAFGSRNVVLAVSNGDDPSLNNWTKHLIDVQTPGFRTDFVTMGLDENGVYLTALHFHVVDLQKINDGHVVVAIKKPELYAGTVVSTRLDIDVNLGPDDFKVWTIQPAVNFDSPVAGGHVWFVAKGPPEHDPIYKGGAIHYRRLQWNGNTAVWVDTTWQPMPEPSPTYRNYFDLDDGDVGAPQAGWTPIALKAVGSRLMMAVIRNGFLWTCQQVGLDDTDGTYGGDETGTSVNRTAVQWLRLQTSATGPPLAYSLHGRIYDDCPIAPYFYHFPSLMVNSAGDMVVGFSGSSTTKFIGAYFGWRLAAGTAVDRPGLIFPGLDSYTSYTWGDYSSTSLDPTDGLTFWTVQEYADFQDGGAYWATRIAKLGRLP